MMNTVLRDLCWRKHYWWKYLYCLLLVGFLVLGVISVLGTLFYRTPCVIPMQFHLFCCFVFFVLSFLFFEVSLLARHSSVYQCPTKHHLITYFLSDFIGNLLYYSHYFRKRGKEEKGKGEKRKGREMGDGPKNRTEAMIWRGKFIY